LKTEKGKMDAVKGEIVKPGEGTPPVPPPRKAPPPLPPRRATVEKFKLDPVPSPDSEIKPESKKESEVRLELTKEEAEIKTEVENKPDLMPEKLEFKAESKKEPEIKPESKPEKPEIEPESKKEPELKSDSKSDELEVKDEAKKEENKPEKQEVKSESAEIKPEPEVPKPDPVAPGCDKKEQNSDAETSKTEDVKNGQISELEKTEDDDENAKRTSGDTNKENNCSDVNVDDNEVASKTSYNIESNQLSENNGDPLNNTPPPPSYKIDEYEMKKDLLRKKSSNESSTDKLTDPSNDGSKAPSSNDNSSKTSDSKDEKTRIVDVDDVTLVLETEQKPAAGDTTKDLQKLDNDNADQPKIVDTNSSTENKSDNNKAQQEVTGAVTQSAESLSEINNEIVSDEKKPEVIPNEKDDEPKPEDILGSKSSAGESIQKPSIDNTVQKTVTDSSVADIKKLVTESAAASTEKPVSDSASLPAPKQKPVVRFDTKPQGSAEVPKVNSAADLATAEKITGSSINNSVLPKIVPNSSDFQNLAGKSAEFLKSVFSTGELPKLSDFSKPVANGSVGPSKDSTESEEEDFVVVDSGVGDSQLDLIRCQFHQRFIKNFVPLDLR